MSLPPKPDFSPSRYPSDHRTYARPPPPDRYRSERDGYPPRSPPQTRYPVDSYVSSRPTVGSYRAPRLGSIPYDRREDDRDRTHRDYWEREREREWREREYPPVPIDPREERERARARERDRPRDYVVRDWERRPDEWRGYEREWERREFNAPPRDRRPRDERRPREGPRESERVWLPRRSRSPPRRMGRSRSPPPANRPSRSPRRRSPSSVRHRSRTRSRSRSLVRPRSRSRRPARRSPSPRRYSRSPSTSPRRNRSPTITPPRHRSPTPSPPRVQSPALETKSRQTPPGPSMQASPVRRRTPSPAARPEASSLIVPDQEIVKETPQADDKDDDVKMQDVLAPVAVASPVLQFQLRRSHSPPTAPRNFAPTPPTPSSPHPRTSLAAKPGWPWRPPRQAEMPKAESPSTMNKSLLPTYTKYQPSKEPEDPEAKALAADITRTRAQRANAAAEFSSMYLAARRAIHELELTESDVRAAELRRMIADDQLERARIGELGIDYSGLPVKLPEKQPVISQIL